MGSARINAVRQRLGMWGWNPDDEPWDEIRKNLAEFGEDYYNPELKEPAIYRSIKLKGQEGDFSQKWLGKDKPIRDYSTMEDQYIPFDYEGAHKTPVAPLQKEVPFGKENRTKKQIMQDVKDEKYERINQPKADPSVYPKKPTQKERTRIISAKSARIQAVRQR